MKKIVLYYLLAITFVASCRRDDDHVFDKSPDERINETLKAYQAAISGSTYGWNATLTTGSGSSFRFYFNFNDSNRVLMYSDFDSSTASAIKESSYRLKALQQPALIFDTYSYIHVLSDPDASVNGGSYGEGLKSDFEFRIDTVTTDSISLTGRFNGSKMVLRKAAQGDRTGWDNKQVMNGIISFRNYFKFLKYWKRLNYGSTQYDMMFDTTVRKVTISWKVGVQTQSVTRGYYYWANGVYFSDPVVNGSATVPGFSIQSFNAGSQIMNVTVNGSAATITGYDVPLNPDVTLAARRWSSVSVNSDYYWISVDGFHVNGVDDAYNIKSLKTDSSEYYYLLYKSNTNGLDAFIPIFLDTVQNALIATYGSWLQMINNSGGRAVFSEYDTRTTPYPASGPAASTRTQMLEGRGYYFAQTSSYSYDMVSDADSKVWLTWYWIW
jgi:uncharacterized protein DUF4302